MQQTEVMLENKRGVEYSISDQIVDREDIKNLTMKDFDDTFNLIIGIKNKDMNWFDNPYISANVYQTKEDWAIKKREDIKV